MTARSRRRFLTTVPLALTGLALPLLPALSRQALACAQLTDVAESICGERVGEPARVPVDFVPWWVRAFRPSQLWPTMYEREQPLGPIEFGQFLRVQAPQDGGRLRVWEPRANTIGFVPAETVGPVGAPEWAELIGGGDGRWIDVTLSVPQHAVAMQADVAVREALVSAGLRGETRPGQYSIIRRVYSETMDSRTVPGVADSYLLRNVLFTQYFTTDGAAIHYNWWGPPYGFGRPGSHGCLGMMYNDSKFFWDWADLGVPVNIHA